MWSKLGIRLLSAAVGVVVVLVIVFLPIRIFNLAISIVSFIAVYELYTTFKQENKWQVVTLDYAAALLMMALPVIRITNQQEMLVPIIIAYLILSLTATVVWSDELKFNDVGTSFFIVVYSVLFLQHLTYLRALDNGIFLIFIPLLGAWMPDTFAYFTGTLIGRHKLAPKISPKKTIEGSIGAVLGCVLMFVVYGFIMKLGFNLSVSFTRLVILALLCGVFAQLGDLSASMIKRENDVKDFGKLIPGHGGILDRIDSLIFVAPLVYYFVLYLPIIK